MPSISVLTPAFNAAAFITRAIDSLFAQVSADWELIVIDDGSTDLTLELVSPWRAGGQVKCIRVPKNLGLGAALNLGLRRAAGDYIAYLPADDVYFAGHLRDLSTVLNGDPQAILAYSGVRHHYNRVSREAVPEEGLQLVQVMHRRTAIRWIERPELVTDSLDRMYWDRLRRLGRFVPTRSVTCEWVDHPLQRHKILREPIGGIQRYKQFYGVTGQLRFHTTVGNYIDEESHYRRFRNRQSSPAVPGGLKIVLAGELAYNAERVVALSERGHSLYGLWMDNPYWYNAIGPSPFGHIQDIPKSNWRRTLQRIRPDVIYALLNWQAVPFAHQIMMKTAGIPFVWHFKEGPFICLERGSWKELVELYMFSDGQIFTSPECQQWFRTVLPGPLNEETCLVLDGDLPKADWFSSPRSPKLSAADGQVHTVVPGRPIGLHPETVAQLSARRVHLHFYGDFTHGQWKQWIESSRRLAGERLHLHSQVHADRWVTEFSRYDAGWLHFFDSANRGEIRRATWDDLNFPARMSTLAAAGLPFIQKANDGNIVATQTLASMLGVGIFAEDMEDLSVRLHDRRELAGRSEAMWGKRELFSFDYHVPRLESFFRRIIAARRTEQRRGIRSLKGPGAAQAEATA